MKNLQRYLGINLLVLVGYTVFCKLTTIHDHDGLGYALLMLFFVGGQTLGNFIASMGEFIRTNGDKAQAKTLLLCSGVVLVIGFSACLGGATLK